jgi:hypothetical protein
MEQKEVKNPFTGRMIKVDGPTYNRLMELGELPVVYQKSKSEEWSKDKPAKGQPSKNLASKCGTRCFLKPDTFEYPICQKLKGYNKCQIDCRALQSAKTKAKNNENKEIEKLATNIAMYKKCEWAKPKIRCNAFRVEPYEKCITMPIDKLQRIAKNCDLLDTKNEYKRDIDKMDKKQLCGYIITHPKKRQVRKFARLSEDYVELYKESMKNPTPLPEFMEKIANTNYPNIDDKNFVVDYIYLYLLIKYRDYGILYFENEGATWFCGDTVEYSTGEKIFQKPFLEFPEDFETNLELHENRYLFLELLLMECQNVKDSHANVLIFDKETQTISRWESSIDLYQFYNQELLDAKLDEFAKSIGYQYQTTYEACSSNFNTIGTTARSQSEALLDEDSPLTDEERLTLESYDLEGPCHLYESLFIEYSLNKGEFNKNIDPKISIDSMNKELIDLFLNSKYTIDEFLYKYRNYILGELFEFIVKNLSYDGKYDKDEIIEFIRVNEQEILDILNGLDMIK